MIILIIIILDDSGDTVDGTNPAPVQVGSLSHYSQGFIHPRWCTNKKESWLYITVPKSFSEPDPGQVQGPKISLQK